MESLESVTGSVDISKKPFKSENEKLAVYVVDPGFYFSLIFQVDLLQLRDINKKFQQISFIEFYKSLTSLCTCKVINNTINLCKQFFLQHCCIK